MFVGSVGRAAGCYSSRPGFEGSAASTGRELLPANCCRCEVCATLSWAPDALGSTGGPSRMVQQQADLVILPEHGPAMAARELLLPWGGTAGAPARSLLQAVHAGQSARQFSSSATGEVLWGCERGRRGLGTGRWRSLRALLSCADFCLVPTSSLSQDRLLCNDGIKMNWSAHSAENQKIR